MLLDDKALRLIILRLFDPPSFDTLLSDTFKGRGLRRLASDKDFEKQVAEVIYNLQQEGQLETMVLEAAKVRAQAHDAELLTLVHQIEAARNAGLAVAANPFETIWLRGGRPFINRRQFRQMSARLIQPNESHVLVVRGKPRTGKSHSRWFLEHIAQATKQWDYVLIDIEKLADSTPDLSAYDLAEALNIRLRLDYPLVKGSDVRPFKIEPFMLQMEAALSQPRTRPLLLAMDGFGHVNLTTPAVELVGRMARMAEETCFEQMSLVLLGFEGDLPPEINPHICIDRTADFSESDIIDFLMLFFEQVLKPKKPGLAIDPSMVARAVAELLPHLAKTPNPEAVGLATAKYCLLQF